MSAKPIREFHGKQLLSYYLPRSCSTVLSDLKADNQLYQITSPLKCAQVSVSDPSFFEEIWSKVLVGNPWLSQSGLKLVAKPDMLLKRRGKSGLLLLNADLNQVREWIKKTASNSVNVDGAEGLLTTFVVEPFVRHEQTEEHYVCIQSLRDGDEIMFVKDGGIDIGDVDAKASRLSIPFGNLTIPNPTAAAANGAEDTGKANKKGSLRPQPPFPTKEQIMSKLLVEISPSKKQEALADFILRLYAVFIQLQFTYLEINPLVITNDTHVHILDLAAKLDQTAEFECGQMWSRALKFGSSPATSEENVSVKRVQDFTGPSMEFPAPFGRELTKEEAYVAELDSKTGASLKLTVLNADGRIWTMVAGGGASVVYSDAIAALGYAKELANYGEYSGAPSETQTYEYAKTILDLLCKAKPSGIPEEFLETDAKQNTGNSPVGTNRIQAKANGCTPTGPANGKVLLIGGGIANFTNVAVTFKGIIRALREYGDRLAQQKVRIYVRRGGPNWQEGIKQMRSLGEALALDMRVFGPDSHITAIVPLALNGKMPDLKVDPSDTAQRKGVVDPFGLRPTTPPVGEGDSQPSKAQAAPAERPAPSQQGDAQMAYFQAAGSTPSHPWYELFTKKTRSFIYGMQPRAVQGMLDFDYICSRQTPSVAAMIYPFGGSHMQKFYWGTQETLLPVLPSVAVAADKFPAVDTVVNFASSRSAYESTLELLQYSRQIKTIAIIAEGVPERRARELLQIAKNRGVSIIGPATVGGIKPGCFKIGNTGGMMDNIVASKLYRPGSVGYVSKSGGMSNELNNVVARTADGVYEGVAIGGDRYPGSTFIDHLLRMEADPSCKILLMLGEVGGTEEYKVAEAVKSGKIRKPVVAWCIGTCAKMFTTSVQFGHAGAMANSDLETAEAKNTALRASGVFVPETFELLPSMLSKIYHSLLSKGDIQPFDEPEPPKIPLDYAWAQELGLVRKPASFVTTICDDRGQELLYAGMRISDVFKEEIGIGGVLSLLWFKRRLPDYACKFIEMVLMLTADHGPAVSGAHNTIVTSRAGKDLVSSLVAGLLTIGDRFGGALDGAATIFSEAYDKSLTPREFVDSMRKANKLILGIGHRIKSRSNPDMRVQILIEFARRHFPLTPLLEYALAVENITTSKKDNLILNVDGCVGVLFVDLLRYCGAFTKQEADEYVEYGTLNGLFVLGRSIGFIGHHLDQKRLKQGLYRHPWDDISYLVSDDTNRVWMKQV